MEGVSEVAMKGYLNGLNHPLFGNPIPCVPFPLGISEGEGEGKVRETLPL